MVYNLTFNNSTVSEPVHVPAQNGKPAVIAALGTFTATSITKVEVSYDKGANWHTLNDGAGAPVIVVVGVGGATPFTPWNVHAPDATYRFTADASQNGIVAFLVTAHF